MPPDRPDPGPTSTEVDALVDALAAEMRERWERGDRPLTEDFLARHPVLRDHPGAAGELICEEVALRREWGEPDASAEVIGRFPEWSEPLRLLLAVRDALAGGDETDYPAAGDRLGEYLLLAEIGRGRRGRVFLARQPDLADRAVVLKLTPREDDEHRTLARLQHTHIVPLYAAHDHPDRRLRALCMPFFGGATLAHALSVVGPVPPADRTPAGVWAAVGTGPGNDPAGPLPLPARWAMADYVRLIAHLGACLADALQFAHEQQLVHLDVKPSNVLLTAGGQPMLLDFHLARPPVSAGGPPPLWLGGTPAYLAPEHRDALAAVRAGRPVFVAVDGRADVFALGGVLYEALAGDLPGDRPQPLAARNRRVSPGLSDIVARCLAAHAADRYPTAAAVADDLRRHLADVPLRGVHNRSVAERWQKWRRRRPHALGVVGGLTLLLAVAVAAAGFIGHRRDEARAALAEGDAELAQGRFAEARGAYRRGLAVADGLPVRGELMTNLAAGLRRADRSATADELHTLAERMRAATVADDFGPGELADADRIVGQLWARRADLFMLTAADLSPAVRDRAREDLLEVAIVWSHLRAQAGKPNPTTARQEATEGLAEAERALGPCAGLYLERADHARAVGRLADAEADLRRAVEARASSAWDHLALGGYHFRHGAMGLARTEFEAAVIRDPRSFWARLQLGRCDLALDRPADALVSFAVCVGLDPDHPAGHLHKGLAHARLGHRGPALADIDRAIALDPTNPQAHALRATVTRLP